MKKILIIFLIFLLMLTGCSSTTTSYPPIYALNTFIDLKLYNDSNSKEHYDYVKKIYQDVNSVCNLYSSNKDCNSIYDLNLNRSIVANDLLIDILNEALVLKEETNGYFNPFIAKIVLMWKDSLASNVLPDDEAIEKYIYDMNNTSIKIDGNNVSLEGEGYIDLGGIAKGYATKKAVEYLNELGVSYLLNAGMSNVSVSDKLGNNFVIGVNEPLNNSKYYATLKIKDISIGVSGIENQYTIIDDNIYHHIINPYSGKPCNYYSSVCLIGNDPLKLDAYSTAMFSMDIDTAKEFASMHNIDVILFKDEILYQSEGVSNYA